MTLKKTYEPWTKKGPFMSKRKRSSYGQGPKYKGIVRFWFEMPKKGGVDGKINQELLAKLNLHDQCKSLVTVHKCKDWHLYGQFPKRKINSTTSNYFPKLLMFPYPLQITCCGRWTPLNKLQYLKKELELPPPIRIRSRPLYCSWHKSAREPKPLGHWRLRGPQSTSFWRG